MNLSFKQGIHPKYRKEISQNKKITKIRPPEKVYIPLQQ
ncbi:MAG: hypothetical protein ACOC4G_11155, partial [Bacillota bacterium]